MARQVPEQYETLGGKLGCYFANVQIFGRCEESNVHNERNRKPEQRASTIKQPKKRISE